MFLIYQRVRDFLIGNNWSFFWLTLIVVLLITLQQYFGGTVSFPDSPYRYTQHNNYLIFKYSFLHLQEKSDLYTLYLPEYWDLFKYSPTFAAFFGIIAWMPDGLGLFVWDLLNALCLWWGIRYLPGLDSIKKNIIYLMVLIELITSLQNSQSNALIAGLILVSFGLMERKHFFWACFCIAITVYIKLFGLFAFAICLLYPQRWRMVGYSVLAMIVLWLIPLMWVDFFSLIGMYKSWCQLLQQDYVPNPLSLVGALKNWLSLGVSSNGMLAFGLVLFVLPLVKLKAYSDQPFRFLFLSMILIWMVVFNHKAESPTFIIAMAGVAVSYFLLPESNGKKYLMWFAVVFTSLSTTDIFPNYIQDTFFDRYSIKLLPCVLFYFFLFYNLITYKDESLHFSGS